MSGKTWACGVALVLLAAVAAWAQQPAATAPAAPPAMTIPAAPAASPTASPAAKAADTTVKAPMIGTAGADEKITLMRMFQWGGPIMWLTMAVGFLALVMSIYFLLTVTPKREVPAAFVKRVMVQIRAGDLRGAYQFCEGRDEILANVIRVGLKMSGHERYVVQDAMESEGERGVMALWQKISYLNSIGVIAPLLGLLGTVWGMVLAFSQIASDNAQVKGIAVASSVSKAMICTVCGLAVAIPSFAVYYFLRGRVVKIIAAVEAQASEVIELLTRGKEE